MLKCKVINTWFLNYYQIDTYQVDFLLLLMNIFHSVDVFFCCCFLRFLCIIFFWILNFYKFSCSCNKRKSYYTFFNLQLHNLILKYYLSYQILYIIWRFLCSQLKHSEVRKQKSKKRRISNRRMFKYLVSNSDNCRLREMMLNVVRSDIHH